MSWYVILIIKRYFSLRNNKWPCQKTPSIGEAGPTGITNNLKPNIIDDSSAGETDRARWLYTVHRFRKQTGDVLPVNTLNADPRKSTF